MSSTPPRRLWISAGGLPSQPLTPPPSTVVTHQFFSPKASDVLHLRSTSPTGYFFMLFFSVVYFLLHCWRNKICSSTFFILTLSELAGIMCLIASFISTYKGFSA